MKKTLVFGNELRIIYFHDQSVVLQEKKNRNL